MATDLIRYDLLVQDAMRGVVRKVLADIAVGGYLPGDHHFTISFRTDAPGVKMSRRLAEQWPQELTIILQHQFSNLTVDDEGFGVTLSFRSLPENLYVPFAAISGFYDPSVEFGLRFETADFDELEEAEEDEAPPARPNLRAVEATTDEPPAAIPAKPVAKTEPRKPAAENKPESTADEEAETESGDAKVVSIDAFRKKT
jgi:hypothetical protein